MSEVKQKLLEKLKKIVRKRESFRKKRRFKRRFNGTSSKWFSFPKDKYKALEEIQQILGFTDEVLRMFFALLEKADGGYLDFQIGDIGVAFHTYEGEPANDIEMMVRVEEKEIIHSAEYRFSQGLQNLAKWKKRL